MDILKGKVLIKQILRKLNRNRTTDVFFIGYPKCGNTWNVVFLGNYLQLLYGNNTGKKIPLFDASDWFGRNISYFKEAPRIQFTHSNLLWESQTEREITYSKTIRPYKKKKIILLVRSIPDVLVSHFWHQQRSSSLYPTDLGEFIRDSVFGIEKCLKFYNLWANAREELQLELIRYEDLIDEPEVTFSRILNFINIPIHKELLLEAIERSSFKSMRTLETESGLRYENSNFLIFGDNEKKEQNDFHVRKGKVGSYREELSSEDILFLHRILNTQLDKWYNYHYDM